MRAITAYTANCIGDATNTLYPHVCTLRTQEEIRNAFRHDYVLATYKDNYRSKDNFICSDVAGMDVDNDHSENPDDWLYPEDLRARLPGVEFIIVYSRHHMKPKDGKSARPRYHVLFAISPTHSGEEYAALKAKIHKLIPEFDKQALDAARFFFGTPNPEVEIYEGIKTIDEYIWEQETEDECKSRTE